MVKAMTCEPGFAIREHMSATSAFVLQRWPRRTLNSWIFLKWSVGSWLMAIIGCWKDERFFLLMCSRDWRVWEIAKIFEMNHLTLVLFESTQLIQLSNLVITWIFVRAICTWQSGVEQHQAIFGKISMNIRVPKFWLVLQMLDPNFPSWSIIQQIQVFFTILNLIHHFLDFTVTLSSQILKTSSRAIVATLESPHSSGEIFFWKGS